MVFHFTSINYYRLTIFGISLVVGLGWMMLVEKHINSNYKTGERGSVYSYTISFYMNVNSQQLIEEFQRNGNCLHSRISLKICFRLPNGVTVVV